MRHMAVEKMELCMIEAAEKCPDARRVASISVSVSYQIDRLKSGFEVRALRSNGGDASRVGHFSAAS